MADIELKKPLPSEEEQKDFYEKLRFRITEWLNTKSGKTSKFGEYLLFAPDLFHLLMKSLLDERIDAKSKALIGSGLLYFIAPIDVLPEGLVGPGGFMDDVIVAAFVVNTLLNKFAPEVLEENWAGDKKLLHTLQKVSETGNTVIGKLPSKSLLGRYVKRKK